MKRVSKHKGKTYDSMAEVERDFFPALHRERLARMRDEDPRGFGRQLAAESLASMRKRLTK